MKPAVITIVTWTGVTSSDWNVATNWSDNAVPNTTDNVVIPQGFSVSIEGSNQSVNNLQCSGNLSITGGSLTLATDSSISGTLTLEESAVTTNGVLTVSGNTTVLPPPAPPTNSIRSPGANVDPLGAEIDGTGSFVNGGTFLVENAFGVNATFTNNATFTWTAGDVDIASGITYTNSNGATLNMTGPLTLGGAGIFSNAGTFNSTGTNNLNATFNNTGTLHVAGLTVMNNGGASSGTFNVTGTLEFYAGPGGGTYTINDGAQWNGAGLYEVAGFTTLNFADAATSVTVQNFELSGNVTLGLAGTLTIASGGSFTWSGGVINGGITNISSGATLTIPANASVGLFSGTINNDGTANIQNATLALEFETSSTTPAVFNNQSDGVFDIVVTSGNSGGLNGGAQGTFNNFGAIDSTMNGTRFNFEVPLITSGTVESAIGVLTIFGGTSTGTWQADSGATIDLAAGYTFNSGSQWNGTGLYLVSTAYNAGPIVIGQGLTLTPLELQLTSFGVLEVDGNLIIAANGTFTAGYDSNLTQITGLGNIKILQSATMQVGIGQGWLSMTGTTLFNYGILDFDADSTFTSVALNMNSNADIFNYGTIAIQNQGGTAAANILIGGFGYLNNFGTVNMDAQGALTLQLEVNNDVAINVQQGTLTLTKDGHAAGVSTGTFDVSDGSTLTLDSSQSLGIGAAFDGPGSYILNFGASLTINDASIDLSPLAFTLNGGTIDGPGQFTVATGSTFAWGAGAIGNTGGFIVQSGVTINAAAAANGTLRLDGATISNSGTINISSDITLLNSAAIDNLAAGKLQVQIAGDGFISDDFTGTLDNAGQLTVIADTSSTSDFTDFAIQNFSNTGAIDVKAGAVDIANKVAQISADGTTLTGGEWMIAASSSLTLFGIETGSGTTSSPTTVTTNDATIILGGAGAAFNALNSLTTNSGEIDLGDGAAITVPGSFTQTSDGTLIVHIGGASNSGLVGILGITGAATLGGTLDVVLDNYLPPMGTTYSILTYTSETGNFATLQNVSPIFLAAANATSYVLTGATANTAVFSVGNISGPPSAISGQGMTVTYTVTNGGTGDADGTWTDSIYISPGTTFNPATAILLGNVTHTGGLTLGSSYNGSITAVAPGVSPGNYSIIVVADSQGQVTSLNRTNNEAASTATVAFTAPALTLGVPLQGTIANGGQQLYALTLDGNSQIQLSLQSAIAAGAQIYVSYGSAPSLSSFDQTAFNVSGTTDSILLNSTAPGTYYILITGRASSGSGSGFTLSAQESSLAITSVTPSSATGTSTIVISGTQFSAGDTVSLIPTGGGTPLAASAIYFTNASTLAATFNLAGLISGTQYDVQVSNGSVNVTAPAAFTAGTAVGVTQPVVFTISAPVDARTGVNYSIQINYQNVSGQDQLAPLVTFTATNALLKLSDSVVFASGTISFLAINSNGGPAGILPAGYQGSITVEVEQTVNQNHTDIGYTLSTADPTQPMDYSALVPYLDSANYTPSEWTAVWNQVQTMLGTTQAGYLRALANAASLLPAAEGNPINPIQDMQVVLDQSEAAITASISGNLTTTSVGLKLGGLMLEAVNTSTGDSFGAYILNNGSFVLPNLTPGVYSFDLGGAELASAGTVTVMPNTPVTGIALTATTGASVTGLTASSATGAPIAGASIFAVGSNGESYVATSGSNGLYQFTGLTADTYTISVISAGSAKLVEENVVIGANGQILNLGLVPGGTITGIVTPSTDSTGAEPIVIAQLPGNTDPNFVFVGTLDSQGDFTFSNLPAGTYNISVSANGYGNASFNGAMVTASANKTIGTINLNAISGISGTVTSTDPNALANAVTIGAYQGGNLIAAVNTDASGNYNFTGLAAGIYQIQPIAYPYFYNQNTVTISPGQPISGINIQLQPGGVISGTLADTSGNPMSGVEVDATDAEGNVSAVLTGPNGSYTISHLGIGAYSVVTVLGTLSQTDTVSVTTENPTSVAASFRTAVGATINGIVYLADGTTPNPNANVTLVEGGQPVAVSTADADGNYKFYLPQGGTFTLEAAGGTNNASFVPVSNVTVATGQNLQQNLQAGSDTLTLTVTDSQQLSGDIVTVYQVSTNLEIASATFDSTGILTFSNLVDGNYQFLVTSAAGDGGLAIGGVTAPNPANIQLALQAEATLTGTITGVGSAGPLAGAYVGAYSTTNSALSFLVPVNSDGTYSIPNVPGGTYDLVAFANNYTASILSAQQVASSSTPFNFSLSSSGNTVLTGEVVDENSIPVSGANVVVLNASNEIIGLAVTGAGGVFSITSAQGSNLSLSIEEVSGSSKVIPIAGSVSSGSSTNLGQIDPMRFGGFNGIGLGNTISPDSVRTAVSAYANPTDLLNSIFSDLQGFPVDRYKLSAGYSSCPDCAAAIQILGTIINTVLNPAIDKVNASDAAATADMNSVIKQYGELVSDATGVIADVVDALTGYAVPTLRIDQNLGSAAGNAALAGFLALQNGALDTEEDLYAFNLTLQQTTGDTITSDVSLASRNLSISLNHLIAAARTVYGYISTPAVLQSNGNVQAEATSLHAILQAASSLLSSLSNSGTLATTVTKLSNDIKQYHSDRRAYWDALSAYKAALHNVLGCAANSSNGCGNHGQGGGAPGSGHIGPVGSTTTLTGHDPNDLFGTAGFGPQNYVLPNQPLGYTIDFENDPSAAAATALVTITDVLDLNLDLNTFSLGNFGFGSQTITVPSGLTSYGTTVTDSANSAYDVRINASLDVSTRTVTWTFTTLDATTGQPPADPLAGFLPPDVNGSGDGFVTYNASPVAGLTTGAVISAQASVVFDSNAAIATPTFVNTVDGTAPVSSVTALAATEAPQFTLQWGGTDAGSGIAYYNIFYSTNGGSYVSLLSNTTKTATVFNGVIGDSYSFYSVAVDNLGHAEAKQPAAEATTTIVQAAIETFNAKTPFKFTDATGNLVTVTLTGPGSAVAILEGGGANFADLRTLTLTGTTSKTKLSITVKKVGSSSGFTIVDQIIAIDAGESLASISLGAGVSLGSGLDDGSTALDVAGNVGSLSLNGLNPDARIIAGGALGKMTLVDLNKTGNAIAIDDASITAASIGSVSVQLTGTSAMTSGTGILDSTFDATTGNLGNITVSVASSAPAADLAAISGSSFLAAGSIGVVSATAKGTAKHPTGGSAIAIASGDGSVDFSAGISIAGIKAAASGAGGVNIALDGSGTAPIDFSAGTAIGAITLSASKSGNSASTAFAAQYFDVTAGTTVGVLAISGKATAIQASEVDINAGSAIAGISIKSTGVAANGSLADSVILAGQQLAITTNASLKKAGIGYLTLSGSLTGDPVALDSIIAATGNIGAVSVGGTMIDVSLAAGFNAGLDGIAFTSDDTFNSNASITSVHVAGRFDDSSIVAGIDPGSDFQWGLGGNDTAGADLPGLTVHSKIGAIRLGAATIPTGTAAPIGSPSIAIETSAIESLALTSLQIGTAKPLTKFSTSHWIDTNGSNVELASDTAVEVVS